ncbi:MAG: hypothetical protein ACE5JX_20880 [Acidobacteriota bacterium]
MPVNNGAQLQDLGPIPFFVYNVVYSTSRVDQLQNAKEKTAMLMTLDWKGLPHPGRIGPETAARWGKGALYCFLSLTLLACGGPGLKKTEVTEENKDELYQQIQSSKELTGEEVRLLDGYLERQQAETGEATLTPGKTVEQMIEEQRAMATAAEDSAASPSKVAAATPGSQLRPKQVVPSDQTRKKAQAQSVSPPPPPPPATAVLAAGSVVKVRLDQALSSKTNRSGDVFHATLEEDLRVDGKLLAARNSKVTGKVLKAQQSGRVKGRAQMTLVLEGIDAGGREYQMETRPLSFEAKGSGKKDAKRIGIGAGAGALIGAIAGGGKGAAIGTVIGGGAGTGMVLATPGKEVEFGVEQLFEFKLAEGVEMRVLRR